MGLIDPCESLFIGYLVNNKITKRYPTNGWNTAC